MGWKCPNCGSTNTGSSTYSDWCNDCDYSFGYFKRVIKNIFHKLIKTK